MFDGEGAIHSKSGHFFRLIDERSSLIASLSDTCNTLVYCPKVIRELAEKILSKEISFSDVVVPVVKEWRVDQILFTSRFQ